MENLDRMTRKELETFVERAETDTRKFAREVFGSKQSGRVAAMQPLRWYAFNRIQAMDAGLGTEDAKPFESMMHALYKTIEQDYSFAIFRDADRPESSEFEKLWQSVGGQFKSKEAKYALKLGFEYGKKIGEVK